MYILGYAILTLVYVVNINNKNHRAGHLFMTPEFFHGCVIVLRPHLETVPYWNIRLAVAVVYWNIRHESENLQKSAKCLNLL